MVSIVLKLQTITRITSQILHCDVVIHIFYVKKKHEKVAIVTVKVKSEIDGRARQENVDFEEENFRRLFTVRCKIDQISIKSDMCNKQKEEMRCRIPVTK